VDNGLHVGAHGLPLMGIGDWNDGMNRVGAGGAGESVWLGWLLFAALNRFAPFAEMRGEQARAELWRNHASVLQTALERDGWDGDYYRRGFFDDGTPLGSSQSEECRIDCIAQSWAMLSGAASPERAAQAMASVERELIRPQDGLAPLFAPPFDKTALDPGYIKGYPPGIRENGGQYTHAAMWMIQALALQGHGGRAVELFDLLNPILSSTTPQGSATYRAEPYVVAADVYSRPPHVGRGGWTWYTGSAAWMYRVAIECILGFELRGDRLHLNPCIPADWPEFELTFRRAETTWQIRVRNPYKLERGNVTIRLDGESVEGNAFRLVDDNETHLVDAIIHPADGKSGAIDRRVANVVKNPPGR
jgi:cyclic beta-1,2-glucan synthetase